MAGRSAVPGLDGRAAVAGPGRRAAGFTLVEVMIALVVLSVGLISLLGLVPLGSRKVTSSTRASRASQLASARAERLLVTPYADDDLDPGHHEDDENPLEGNLWVTWEVENDQPIAGCKRITVSARPGSATATAIARILIVTPRAGG